MQMQIEIGDHAYVNVYLDHGFSEDLNEWFSREARRGEAGRYDPDDPAPELAGSAQVEVGMGSERHRDRSPNYEAVDDPGFGGA